MVVRDQPECWSNPGKQGHRSLKSGSYSKDCGPRMVVLNPVQDIACNFTVCKIGLRVSLSALRSGCLMARQFPFLRNFEVYAWATRFSSVSWQGGDAYIQPQTEPRREASAACPATLCERTFSSGSR